MERRVVPTAGPSMWAGRSRVLWLLKTGNAQLCFQETCVVCYSNSNVRSRYYISMMEKGTKGGVAKFDRQGNKLDTVITYLLFSIVTEVAIWQ